MLKATMFKSGCMTLYLRKMVRLIHSCLKLICLKVVGRVRRQRITLHIKEKYYPVGAGGGGFYGTYSLTDETINVEDDNMYNGGGSIIFTMIAEGNIVVKSVNGVDDTRFKVGNEFILVQ